MPIRGDLPDYLNKMPREIKRFWETHNNLTLSGAQPVNNEFYIYTFEDKTLSSLRLSISVDIAQRGLWRHLCFWNKPVDGYASPVEEKVVSPYLDFFVGCDMVRKRSKDPETGQQNILHFLEVGHPALRMDKPKGDSGQPETDEYQ